MTVIKFSGSHTLKKQHGQNFLRDNFIAQAAVDYVKLDQHSSVLEIGCGDGFLTRTILAKPLARLWVFEIDPEWSSYVEKTIHDKRLVIFNEDILQVDFKRLQEYKPWALIANLPYHITFPILFKIQQNRFFFTEGVIMVQEEVAQKIVKQSGRGYGFTSLFFQNYFDWQLLEKVSPIAFVPQPKVYSRLMHFVPKQGAEIPLQEEFWQFIKFCFQQPRRTLKNNIMQTHYAWEKISATILAKRAQQLSMEDFLQLWGLLIS